MVFDGNVIDQVKVLLDVDVYVAMAVSNKTLIETGIPHGKVHQGLVRRAAPVFHPVNHRITTPPVALANWMALV